VKTFRGDIWSLVDTHLVVVPVNRGYNARGLNICGKGLALQAAQRYPDLARWFGDVCMKQKDATPVTIYPDGPLILFPTKGFNPKHPELSWQTRSTVELIEQGLGQLIQLPYRKPIAVPMLGCGAGGLHEADVLPLFQRYLKDDRFTMVYPGGKAP
jgi:hypothetical protein